MKNSTRFAAAREHDVICLGRLAMDLYAQQIGAPLEDVASFAKYLGGSSANIAFGCARLGLQSAMLARVGDDHPGRFLRESLAHEGCDVSHVRTDRQRLTALVLLGIKDRDTFPLIFYRENCADMAVDVDDFDEAFIASSKALLITGTHFSTAHVHRVSNAALDHARRNDVRTVLDIDYRPVLWGLTGKADGETRFIAADRVTAHLQGILPKFDLVVGTIEEFMIAGGGGTIDDALRGVRRVTNATLVVKRGPLGCAVIEGPVSDGANVLDRAFNYRGLEVEVLNVLGAGDAFMSGFLSGWLRGEDYATCCRYANACGALVVSRHGCAPAMPTRIELDYFIANAVRLTQPNRDATLARLHRVTAPRARRDEVYALAFDDRAQCFELAREAGADQSRLLALKRLLVRAVAETERALKLEGRVGVLIDDRYGQDALNDATGRGWWIGRPVELPRSDPLVFEHGRSIGTTILSWPQTQVVKCRCAFHPDDAVERRLENEAQLRALYEAVQASGHELLLEIVPPQRLHRADDTVYRALKRLYNLGIYPEWWTVEPMTPDQWRALDALIAERDPYCRGVLLAGLKVTGDARAAGFHDARASTSCRGFTVGGTVVEEPARRWLTRETDDATLIAEICANYETVIGAWREARIRVVERAA